MLDPSVVEMRDLLAQQGPFADVIAGFKSRAQQQEMAECVCGALASNEVLVCEAGTGTGKTLAYLVPAVLSGLRVIISTGTRNLQEQLYSRDLPVVLETLGALDLDVALLKGRANYLCKHRLDAAVRQPGLLDEPSRDLHHVQDWARLTRSGDIGECGKVAESASIWSEVTSTVENCLGTACEFYESCHVLKARRRAQSADLVIVNHHLFFADMSLREEGFGELLPGADAVIFDEAHQLPDVATRFFGQSLSARQIRELIVDTRRAYEEEAGDLASLVDALFTLEQQTSAFRQQLGGRTARQAWSELVSQEPVRVRAVALEQALDDVLSQLELLRVRGKELETCHRRCAVMLALLATLSKQEPDDYIRWIETQRLGFAWHMSPLEIGPVFSQRMTQNRAAWVFTSATLAIGDSLDNFATRLGLRDYRGAVWDSPFDYARQSLCYLPDGLPEPREPNYTESVVEAVLPIVEASKGRAFLLFTSHLALDKARALLEGSTFSLWVQGSAPKEELLRKFRQVERSLLLGTYSFWEGVDVRGDALSCVVIDKLPFASPDDPVLQARAGVLRAQGLDPFSKLQLPQAVIALKQGVGRLIRDESDRGVLVLCDPRLRSKGYGKVFLKSLPPIPTTSDVGRVRDFLMSTGQ